MVSVIIAAITISTILAMVKNIAMVLIGLGFVIFVHELGHFLVAKACGVKCDKFYIGFDVPINLGLFTIPGKLVHFQWGETEYGIGAIPLGGYVKMMGQDDNPNNAESESERTLVRDEQGNVRKDPRSFTAKSVPQRMAIISAGVIMNIFFGFIFASIAYSIGVKYEPAQFGYATPGDPAWRENIQPGDRVLQMGKSGLPSEHVRFLKDMLLNLMLYHGYEKKIELLLRHSDGQEEWVAVTPSDKFRNLKKGKRPTIGVLPAEIPVFDKVKVDGLPFVDSQFEILSDGDRLISIDGEPATDDVAVQRLLARNIDKPITLVIEKAANPKKKDAPITPEQYTLKVPPTPARDYGVTMEFTPITAIQKNSPAEKAGLQVGDKLLSFAGEPIGDPIAFSQRTLNFIGKTEKLEVERTAGASTQKLSVDVELRVPPQMSAINSRNATASSIAVETIGIAFDVTNVVATVRAGGPAEGKLRSGDKLLKFSFDPANKEQAEIEGKLIPAKHLRDTETIDNVLLGWLTIAKIGNLVRLPDTHLIVTVSRGDKEVLADLAPVDSKDVFIDDRRLPFKPLEEVHRASNVMEAMSLGAREMKERMMEVATIVRKLVTGEVSLFDLGGPLQIVTVATGQAERGIIELLMFFAFLSANLAVMNFLPIPALDGGHMLFLTYEAIFRRPVNEKLQMWLSAFGILCLLSLMVFATVLDVGKLFE